VEQLLQEWGVEAIASVGSQIPYDPHLHQLMEGTAQPGETVRVRYIGYRQAKKLLYRAKVSPVGNLSHT
jgi:molecular chaperone GrpE (heat shock protein)